MAGPITVRLQPVVSEPGAAPLSLPDPTADRALPASRAGPTTRPPTAISPAPAGAQRVGDRAGLAAPTDPTYYPARQLDVYPALLAPLSVRYPERALEENRAGRVLVMLRIDAAGKVDDVAIVEADPPGYFEEAAHKTLETAAFSAARKNGVAVRSRVLIHINFGPGMATAAPQ